MDREDLDSEAVVGLLAELSRADPAVGGLAQRLWWAAFRGAHSARKRSALAVRQLAPDVGERAHTSAEASGHPDLALARLCREGIISAAEGDLIGRTRLEGEPLAVAARRLGISYEACAKRRGRAERRVLEHLTERAAEPGAVVRCLPSGRTGGVFTDAGLLAE
ncbi:hypothetical protein ACFXJ5_18080 [Streptomyces sp. NPDC059373]